MLRPYRDGRTRRIMELRLTTLTAEQEILMSATVLPPIDRWWPHLDIDFKHEILANLDDPLSTEALAEVARLCDSTIEPGPAALSDSEKEYIRTQIEVVD